jgi:hypothetical protein
MLSPWVPCFKEIQESELEKRMSNSLAWFEENLRKEKE